MFVRTGTVRKGRGSSNRRANRRHRRYSNENSTASRTSDIHDDPSSTGSSYYGHEDACGSSPASLNIVVHGTAVEKQTASALGGAKFARESTLCNTHIEMMKYKELTLNSSPARSQAKLITVSVIFQFSV